MAAMNQVDVFFTQTIVGPPLSVVLGERMARPRAAVPGVQVDLGSGRYKLADAWRDWIQLSHADDAPGTPRRRPGAVRRALERHALAVALLGLAALGGTAAWWHLMGPAP